MTTPAEQEKTASGAKKNIARRFLQVAMSVIVTAIILLVSAGKIDWLYAWTYIASSLLVLVVNAFLLPSELISERGRKKENVEKWDRVISGLLAFPWLALYLVSGLDFRFGWSPELAFWIHTAGVVVFFLGNALVSWAMVSNIYFSTSVRIQYDRGHTVSANGPYRLMRHPGYLGMMTYLLASPLVFGSFWAFIPAVFAVILFVVRTAFEDKTLRMKLDGYEEYVEKVPYRLIPGLW